MKPRSFVTSFITEVWRFCGRCFYFCFMLWFVQVVLFFERVPDFGLQYPNYKSRAAACVVDLDLYARVFRELDSQGDVYCLLTLEWRS